MIWGEPKLMLYFGNQHIYGLSLEIQNVPIANRFLKLIHVKRDDAKDVGISIHIHDADRLNDFDGYIYGDAENRILSFNINDIKGTRIALPPSYYPATTFVIRTGEKYGSRKTFVCDGNAEINTEVNTELITGLYLMSIVIYLGGKIANVSRQFKVNAAEPWVEWVQKGKDNKVLLKFKGKG